MFIVGVSRPLLRLLWRYEVLGRENLPPGGFVLAAGRHTVRAAVRTVETKAESSRTVEFDA